MMGHMPPGWEAEMEGHGALAHGADPDLPGTAAKAPAERDIWVGSGGKHGAVHIRPYSALPERGAYSAASNSYDNLYIPVKSGFYVSPTR